MVAAAYEVSIDWNNDGDFSDSNEDVSANLVRDSLTWDRGKNRQLGRTQAGTAGFRLKNLTGLYNPDNSGGALFGSLLPYRPVRIRANEGSDRDEWYGFISSIKPEPSLDGDHTCYFYCVDGMEWLARSKVPANMVKTLTAPSTVDSRTLTKDNQATWAAAHDAAAGTVNDTAAASARTNKDGAADWDVERPCLFFNTSSLPSDSTIVSVTVWLRDFTGGSKSEADAQHATIFVVEGVFDNPIVAANYGAQLSKVTPGGIITHDSWQEGEGIWNGIPLTTTGIAFITKAGETKLCLRNKGDVDDTAPSGNNHITFYFPFTTYDPDFDPYLEIKYYEAT